MNSCVTIAISNQKGGVGKTTTAINLSTAIAAFGKRVLLIDLDPQGNSTTGVGGDAGPESKTIYDLFIGRAKPEEVIQSTKIKRLEVVPSNINLAAAEMEIADFEEKEFIFKKVIQSISHNYDFIIVDCPPSLNLLTINALIAANKLIIPLQAEFFALEGMVHLRKTVSLIQKNFNRGLEIEGIVLTMMDRRNKLCNQVEEDVRSVFKDKVFSTSIPRNIKLSEAPSHGMPAIIYDTKCAGSYAYMMLAKELLSRLGQFNDNNVENNDTGKESVG